MNKTLVTSELINSRDFTRARKIDEIMDVFDSSAQECVPIDDKDCFYVTNPAHGGKVTCYKCEGFIAEGNDVPYWDRQHKDEFPNVHFHKRCFNQYEHYYGLNKSID